MPPKHSTIEGQRIAAHIQVRVTSQRIADAWPMMSEAQRSLIGAMHVHYENEFGKHKQAARVEEVAATVHDLIDNAIEGLRATDPAAAGIRCARGCCACCKQNVDVTLPEAVLLLRVAAARGVQLDWARIGRQAHTARGEWNAQPLADWACAFLSDAGECRAYEHRPSACRRHAVVSEPAQCDIQLHPGARVLNWVCMEAEVLSSAAAATFESGSLPVMLQKARVQVEGKSQK